MARYLLGIDLGTSSVRAGIFREDGAPAGIAARTYPIETPVPGAAEQDPELWWRGTCESIREALAKAGIEGRDITAVSFSGQMHGGVMLDACDNPVGRAIIWADSRSAGECAEIEDIIGREVLGNVVMNRVFPGTFAATAFWMRKYDPRMWGRVRRLLLPKDYIRYRMCGLFQSEPSDASATLLFDLDRRDWSEEVLKRLRIPIEFLPLVTNSDQIVAETEGVEDETGLPDGIPLVTGGSDQAASALGNGLLDEGAMFVAVGTGGQIVTPLTQPLPSPDLSLNTFCHLPENRWYLMGATLSAGLSLKWYRDIFAAGISFPMLDAEAEKVPAGCEGLMFDPFLAGRRSPEMNPSASGLFRGIRLNHTRGHFVRAVLEGVAYDLRDCLDVIRGMGKGSLAVTLSGGGARSPLWTGIIADVFNSMVMISGAEEQACFGTALLAGVGSGVYGSYRDAAALAPKPFGMVEPDPKRARVYEESYARWRAR